MDEYDAFAISGGFEEFGFYKEDFSEKLSDVIHQFNCQHKIIATVCVTALALAHSGILTGKRLQQLITSTMGFGRNSLQNMV